MDNIIKVKVGDITYGIMSGGSKVIKLDKNNWLQDPTSGGYYQKVDVEDISQVTTCTIDLIVKRADEIDKKYKLWSNIFNAETRNKGASSEEGQIIFYSKIVLNEDLDVLVKW